MGRPRRRAYFVRHHLRVGVPFVNSQRTLNRSPCRRSDASGVPESHNGAFVRGSSRLQATLDKVRQLRGLLPICSYCKRIRNDQNDWERVEVYVSEHTDAMFTHGICPACLEIAKAEFDRDEAATETPRGRL